MKKLTFFALLLSALLTSPLFSQNNFLAFDGNDRVNCGSIMPTSYTKEAWVNRQGGGNNNIISGSGGGQHALWAPIGYGFKVSAGHNGNWNAVQDPVALPITTWTHYAVTYDAGTGTMNLYKNGNTSPVSFNTEPNFLGGNDLQVGSYDNGNNLNGMLDEVRVWNVVRTPAEIAANYDKELNGNEAGLVVYYNFNTQGTCGGANAPLTTLTDNSINGNDGTMTNFSGMLNNCTSNFTCADPPCNSAPLVLDPPSGGAAVPTLSQWGLIILTLLLLSFATIAIRRRQLAMAGAISDSGVSLSKLPFNKARFIKILLPLAVLVLAVFSLAIAMFGYELTNADVPGTLMAVPLLAYLLHMLGGEEE